MLRFYYDPWRGGFELRFEAIHKSNGTPLFDGLLTAYLDEGGRLASLESFGSRVALAGLYTGPPKPGDRLLEGQFELAGERVELEGLVVIQRAQWLELWFGPEGDAARDLWSPLQDRSAGLTAWFSRRQRPGPVLVGLALDLRRAAVPGPFCSLGIRCDDFK